MFNSLGAGAAALLSQSGSSALSSLFDGATAPTQAVTSTNPYRAQLHSPLSSDEKKLLATLIELNSSITSVTTSEPLPDEIEPISEAESSALVSIADPSQTSLLPKQFELLLAEDSQLTTDDLHQLQLALHSSFIHDTQTFIDLPDSADFDQLADDFFDDRLRSTDLDRSKVLEIERSMHQSQRRHGHIEFVASMDFEQQQQQQQRLFLLDVTGDASCAVFESLAPQDRLLYRRCNGYTRHPDSSLERQINANIEIDHQIFLSHHDMESERIHRWLSHPQVLTDLLYPSISGLSSAALFAAARSPLSLSLLLAQLSQQPVNIALACGLGSIRDSALRRYSSPSQQTLASRERSSIRRWRRLSPALEHALNHERDRLQKAAAAKNFASKNLSQLGVVDGMSLWRQLAPQTIDESEDFIPLPEDESHQPEESQCADQSQLIGCSDLRDLSAKIPSGKFSIFWSHDEFVQFEAQALFSQLSHHPLDRHALWYRWLRLCDSSFSRPATKNLFARSELTQQDRRRALTVLQQLTHDYRFEYLAVSLLRLFIAPDATHGDNVFTLRATEISRQFCCVPRDDILLVPSIPSTSQLHSLPTALTSDLTDNPLSYFSLAHQLALHRFALQRSQSATELLDFFNRWHQHHTSVGDVILTMRGL